MRYADYAYAHASDRPNDPQRGEALDNKAEVAGYSNTADYVHDVQGQDGTRSFETSAGRTCWANQEAGLYGWNNPDNPEASTVVPARNAEKNFETQKKNEADRQGIDKSQIEEKGPLTDEQRQAPDPRPDRDSGGQDQGGAQGSGSPGQAEPPEAGQDKSDQADTTERDAELDQKYDLPPSPPPPPQRDDEQSSSQSSSQGQSR